MSVTTIQTKTGPRRVASLRQCINLFCRECIYDARGGEGTWRQQVQACTSYKCPLYEVRPISATQEGGPVGEDGVDDVRPVEAQKTAIQAPEMTRMDLIRSQMEDEV